ncbi:hypothetical protein EPN81_04375 [Patescibacteria group bacterium]|nr:MAG: hypothetical protein EPN81_04375 [Patescibacteria group bacterium]
MTKFEKVTAIVSIPIVVLVAAVIIGLDIMSGMWKADLMALGGIALIIVLFVTAHVVGRVLRGRFQPTKHLFNEFLLGAVTALILDAAFVVIAAFTVGYQPWLIWLLLPGFAIGVLCLAACAMIGGIMQKEVP